MRPQPTFFFYDLETSGRDPRTHRIMQFAGQRTDLDLNPIGEPIDVLVALADDVLPEPQAIAITGITPQKTLEEGYSEADFLRLLHEQVLAPGTIMTGFNSVRFDDEFMRYTLYRNFYDPYEWAWKDGRSRWDVLDLVRMTRALRPDGIEWPFDETGQPMNRLEKLSSINGLDHQKAHDALSDVGALVAVAKLIKTRQPQLFEHLLKMRDKKQVAGLANLSDPKPFVYSSGRYPKETLHTTVAVPVAEGGSPGVLVVYDLRHDPATFAAMSVDELKTLRFADRETRGQPDFTPLPAKELAPNKCPAVAPLGVLDDAAQQRIGLTLDIVRKNLAALRASGLADKLRQVFAKDAYPAGADVDAALYDGFVGDADKFKMSTVRAADAGALANLKLNFADGRLNKLLTRYKARNYPQSLSGDERAEWEAYRAARLARDLPPFMAQLRQLGEAAAEDAIPDSQQFVLQELQLWAESIAPAPE